MATSALALINGIPRMQSITLSQPLIYDQSVTIVATGGVSPSSLNSPVTSGTAVTLPSSGTYTVNANSIANLQIYLNGDRLEQVLDWNTSGAGPNFTAVTFTINLVTGDRVDFRIERTS